MGPQDGGIGIHRVANVKAVQRHCTQTAARGRMTQEMKMAFMQLRGDVKLLPGRKQFKETAQLSHSLVS